MKPIGMVARLLRTCIPRAGMKPTIRPWFAVIVVLGCCLPRLLGQAGPVRRVLILYEVGTSYPLTNLVDEGIRKALANSPYRIEIYREYLDTVLFSDPTEQLSFRNFYLHKYKNHKPDVVITVGSSPLKFMAEAHRDSFPGVPIVFCFPNVPADSGELDPDFTGVEGDISPDRANRLTGGIGGVMQTVSGGRLRHVGIDDAGFDDGHAQLGIQSKDPVQPVQGDHDSVGHR